MWMWVNVHDRIEVQGMKQRHNNCSYASSRTQKKTRQRIESSFEKVNKSVNTNTKSDLTRKENNNNKMICMFPSEMNKINFPTV